MSNDYIVLSATQMPIHDKEKVTSPMVRHSQVRHYTKPCDTKDYMMPRKIQSRKDEPLKPFIQQSMGWNSHGGAPQALKIIDMKSNPE